MTRFAQRGPFVAVLSLAVLALLVGPVGTAVFVLGFGLGESPCVLCWAQRTAMILVALTGLFVLRYGPRPRYLGLSVLVTTAGLYMAIRQSALHAARDIGQGFAGEILGAHTYVWSAFIFLVCLLTMGVLLMLGPDGPARADDDRDDGAPGPMPPFQRALGWLFLVVVGANIVQAFASTGPPPYIGQSDPVRFSFNPRHWVWSMEEWGPAPVSLRGRFAVERPDVTAVDPDPARSPLQGTASLPGPQRRALPAGLDGSPTDLAYDGATDRCLLTTEHGVYVLDGALTRILRGAVVDTGFSVDLARFSGAAFLDNGEMLAVSENKSYVILREATHADPSRTWRLFLEGMDSFEEVARSRFATVRARMNYVGCAAFDPSTASVFTISVPNSRSRRMVISRFDRRDLTLAEEFLPSLAARTDLALARGRSLDELYVTGASIRAGRIYAVSAAYSTMLVIDPRTHEIVEARVLPGLDRAVGSALRGEELLVVDRDGRVLVYRLS